MTKTTTIVALAVSLAVAVPAFAATSTTTRAANLATRIQTAITRSDAAIEARITALTNVSARVAGLKNVSDSEKASIAGEIQSNIDGLTSLKAKIDADSDLTTAQTDEKMIVGGYRIYALVIPRGYIAAAADRVNVIADLLSGLSQKLSTRVSQASSAGKDVSALQSDLTDMNAHIADAKTQAAAAVSAIANLSPDQGDKTLFASNTAALKTARADIKAATADIIASRKDAQAVAQGLRKLSPSSTATTTQ